MSELNKLKKENKQLKALLRNAVELLDKYKEVLKNPEKLGLKEDKNKKTQKTKKSDKSDKPEKSDKQKKVKK